MFRLLLICSQFFLLLLGIFAFIEGEIVLCIADLTIIGLMFTLLVITDRLISLDSGIDITGTVGFFFLYYLFYSGSARNQAFLWYYCLPIISSFLMGKNKGLFLSLGLWCFTLLTHLLRDYLPRFTPYSEGFVMRILSSYMLVIVLMYIYEFSREATSRRLKDSIAELREKAIRDGLTGLYNRRYLDEVWNLLGRQNTDSEKSLAFIMVDIDFFKKYNDRYGHQKGDDVLSMIARTLEEQIRRNTDYVFRYGGEEFAVLLYGVTHERTERITRQIVEAASAMNIPHSEGLSERLTLSAGCCLTALSQPLDQEKIIKCADDALYKAKSEGRNRYVLSEIKNPA